MTPAYLILIGLAIMAFGGHYVVQEQHPKLGIALLQLSSTLIGVAIGISWARINK